MKVINSFLGLFLIITDLFKSSISKNIKHFFLVQSWWRLLIILLGVGIIGYGYNIFLSIIFIGLTVWFLLGKQKKYAKQRREWDSYSGNEHFIVPIIASLFLMGILQGVLIKNAVPKYEIIKEVVLSKDNITDNKDFYININGMSRKLETGKNCSYGQKVKIYRETKDVFWFNPNIIGDYYLDCNRPMRKYTNI
jgi:hypothetical protein